MKDVPYQELRYIRMGTYRKRLCFYLLQTHKNLQDTFFVFLYKIVETLFLSNWYLSLTAKAYVRQAQMVE